MIHVCIHIHLSSKKPKVGVSLICAFNKLCILNTELQVVVFMPFFYVLFESPDKMNAPVPRTGVVQVSVQVWQSSISSAREKEVIIIEGFWIDHICLIQFIVNCAIVALFFLNFCIPAL